MTRYGHVINKTTQSWKREMILQLPWMSSTGKKRICLYSALNRGYDTHGRHTRMENSISCFARVTSFACVASMLSWSKSMNQQRRQYCLGGGECLVDRYFPHLVFERYSNTQSHTLETIVQPQENPRLRLLPFRVPTRPAHQTLPPASPLLHKSCFRTSCPSPIQCRSVRGRLDERRKGVAKYEILQHVVQLHIPRDHD